MWNLYLIWWKICKAHLQGPEYTAGDNVYSKDDNRKVLPRNDVLCDGTGAAKDRPRCLSAARQLCPPQPWHWMPGICLVFGKITRTDTWLIRAIISGTSSQNNAVLDLYSLQQAESAPAAIPHMESDGI